MFWQEWEVVLSSGYGSVCGSPAPLRLSLIWKMIVAIMVIFHVYSFPYTQNQAFKSSAVFLYILFPLVHKKKKGALQ